MRVIRCDRCGKEIPQKNWVDFPILKMEITYDPLLGVEHIDLCDECKKDFNEWLKGGAE